VSSLFACGSSRDSGFSATVISSSSGPPVADLRAGSVFVGRRRYINHSYVVVVVIVTVAYYVLSSCVVIYFVYRHCNSCLLSLYYVSPLRSVVAVSSPPGGILQ
jgi:hypothetical protein